MTFSKQTLQKWDSQYWGKLSMLEILELKKEIDEGAAISDLFDYILPPSNLAVWTNNYWSSASTNIGHLAASTTVQNSGPIGCDIGSDFAISGYAASLTLSTIGLYFNSAGDNIGVITPANLVDIPGGKRLSVPNIVGVSFVGFNRRVADTNVIIQAGPDVITEPQRKIKEEFLPNQFVDDGENHDLEAYLRGLSPSSVSSKKYGLIVSGQSNAAGRADAATQPANFISAGRTWAGVNYWPNNESINDETATPVFNNFALTSTDQFGFDLYLYKLLLDYLKIKNADPTYTIYAIKQAVGGTPISEKNMGTRVGAWQPILENIPSSKRKLISEAKNRIRKAIELFGSNFEVKAVVWHQGESDNNLEAASDYYKNLKNVIAYYRGILANPSLPFIIGGINTSSTGYNATINASMRQIASEDQNVHYIDVANGASYLKSDLLHFNALGNEDLATKIFNIIKDF